ncbi:excinuclease ABC A subunit [Breznakia sp. PF5-3]|uniref:excinuclease ABC subunit UvrA n=1 Tax=unclassified Breznakia TaxID=2623764 RepID=UPI0024077257|nr:MULTISPECIES: excinuclease ABC subunit UvrA [unclassified Breznakia]MDF9824742.1 excinuclease ABC A subunit [Breznakia sp. PM6-1]MDF9835691.1 excinuclease ABC A subunit [Breznakia sp. PF5-3]MDF9837740.1 excinuclease ABC A subunit [Breznakia sp. PFB2-8]MDF9859701.1 excinuclease ABC A subunit [Breznakia sp. PH5-24]
MNNNIIIQGLKQNNLKNVSLQIPKHKLIVFTGVSGSGKSSIVFDTIAAESQRQMKDTYPAFIRGRMPKYPRPDVDKIENLSASIIIDQTPLGGNIRSTVGTISDLYTSLRLLYSRIGKPFVGSASHFSFNDPNGMCPTCSGIGITKTVDINKLVDFDKSLNQGCIKESTFAPNTWYWKQYKESKLFDMDKPIAQYSDEELSLLLYGRRNHDKKLVNEKITGVYHKITQKYLTRDLSKLITPIKDKGNSFISQNLCPDCQGKRLNSAALNCKIMNYTINDMCEMELSDLIHVLETIHDASVQSVLDTLKSGIKRLIDIGLPYLHLNRESSSLSGGEAQRLKLVRYMGSSLTDMIYIFDEPSVGMHPHDVERMILLLQDLRDKGNTVIVVEHDRDIIAIADEIIDIGKYAGTHGGNIVFQGDYKELLLTDTLTARALLEETDINHTPRKWNTSFSIKDANQHNLKHVHVNIPKHIINVISGVAGSGKSTLISKVFTNTYPNDIIHVDQSQITTSTKSTPATYLDILSDIRTLFANHCNVGKDHFSFNSTGACEKCQGKGVLITELIFMDPIINTCEHCGGNRYNQLALSYTYKHKNIVDVLNMSIEEALMFFDHKKINTKLQAMKDVGLAYMSLGQPLSTLSGGELQRIKLAKHLNKKGKVYVFDEPTTGLHISDIKKLLKLFNHLADKGNTLIIIEHNLDVIKQADWIIDIGPNGGKNGGEVVFQGTPLDMLQYSKTHTANSLRKAVKNT